MTQASDTCQTFLDFDIKVRQKLIRLTMETQKKTQERGIPHVVFY